MKADEHASSRLEQAFIHLRQKGKVSERRDMAAKLGVHSSFLSSLITGKRVISERTAKNLEEEFGIKASWLLTGVGDEITEVTTRPSQYELMEQLCKNQQVILSDLSQIKEKLGI